MYCNCTQDWPFSVLAIWCEQRQPLVAKGEIEKAKVDRRPGQTVQTARTNDSRSGGSRLQLMFVHSHHNSRVLSPSLHPISSLAKRRRAFPNEADDIRYLGKGSIDGCLCTVV